MKFRKKPVVIEAHQFDGTFVSMESIKSQFPELKTGRCSWHEKNNTVSDWGIHSKEGTMTVSKDDWIIKGVKGEFYPCKPDIFEATYEEVKDA